MLLNRFKHQSEPENILAISDDEFVLLQKILNCRDPKNYLPVSEIELSLCQSLVNHGWLDRKSDSTFTLTGKALKHYA